MSMREVVEEMRRQLDHRGVDSLAYCLGGHGYINPESVVGESHGACPGPVIVIERDPDAVPPEPIGGGVVREPPPCARCFGPTVLGFGDEGDLRAGEMPVLAGRATNEEWSFDLELGGNRAEVCLRCLAAALAEHDPPITLHAVRGRAVPWR